jgi:hypothetical protein
MLEHPELPVPVVLVSSPIVTAAWVTAGIASATAIAAASTMPKPLWRETDRSLLVMSPP